MDQVSTINSVDTMKQLYLAERQRRSTIRGQVGIPVTIITFMMFGYVTFASNFDVARWDDALTLGIMAMQGVSLAFLLASMVFLAQVEMCFLRTSIPRFEDVHDGADGEKDYLYKAYRAMRATNERAEGKRSVCFLLMLLALCFFVAATALLPFQMAQ